MVKVRKNIVSSNVASKVTYGGVNAKRYIVIHETANTSKGANADAHGRLQANGNSRQASWHYSVDDKEAVKSFSDNAQCWHAGNAKFNKESIGIEICVNSDGDYKKAVDNTISLTKKLMDKHGISADNVVQHNAASGKDCPRYLRAGNKGVTWTQFKNRLAGKAGGGNSEASYTPPKAGGKSISQMASEVIAGKHGSGHSARKKSLGISDAEYAKVRAEVNKRLGKKTKPKPAKKRYPLPSGVLRAGSRGNNVKQLQQALNAANFKVGKADGIFGAKTEDAVRRFQSVHDAYNVDGVYGPRTKTRLDKVVN